MRNASMAGSGERIRNEGGVLSVRAEPAVISPTYGRIQAGRCCCRKSAKLKPEQGFRKPAETPRSVDDHLKLLYHHPTDDPARRSGVP